MGRKERKIAKDLEKKLLKIIKDEGKKFDIKKISGFIYKKKGDFFFCSLTDVVYRNSKFILKGRIEVKPYKLDDIFWDVFEIPQNKKAPISLRANGAFVAPSLTIKLVEVELSPEDDLKEKCNEFLTIFEETINSYLEQVNDIESFMKYHKEEMDEDSDKLILVLLYILQEKYKEALIIVENEIKLGKTGGFGAGDKDIYDFAKEYCEKRLLEIKN
ncbi:hypothetical protein [Defluviitalea phaphyphila]|uniref:hypothetical protein n=1 Tax=Defluviitalea phaphyphila TaxID=1473580 RepID=UPI0007307131|nr:hypothetical protein [Defluviitalea phaphyphila]